METCNRCGIQLSDNNWYPSLKTRRTRICKDCNNKKTSQWKRSNPEASKAMQKRGNQKIKETKPGYNNAWMRNERATRRKEMIEAYGGKCRECGIDDPVVLDIDHINNDGGKHRKNGFWGWRLYRWLRKNNWPQEGYQLLCRNCNWKKEMNRRVKIVEIIGRAIMEIEKESHP